MEVWTELAFVNIYCKAASIAVICSLLELVNAGPFILVVLGRGGWLDRGACGDKCCSPTIHCPCTCGTVGVYGVVDLN